MSAPHVLILDSDRLRAEVTSLRVRKQFGDAVTATVVKNGEAAVDQIADWNSRGEPIALMIIDRATPRVKEEETCIQTLSRLAPRSQRLLASDFADRGAAIQTIADGFADDMYVHGMDTMFTGAVENLVAEWKSREAEGDSVRLIGPRWSKQTHDLKEFLTMSHVPFVWEDSKEAAVGAVEVVLPNGATIPKPSIAELATALDITQPTLRPQYDLVVVGSGPGGLSAAVNGASEGLQTLVLERDAPGGQAGHSSRIENYPGFPAGISGGDLTAKMADQARRLGAEIVNPVEVAGIRHHDGPAGMNELTLTDGRVITTKSVVIATGVEWRRMDAPGVDRYLGQGVYYGASTAETRAYAGETVAIVGGANSAGQAAMDLSKSAKEVHLIVRGDSIEKGMSDYLVKQVRSRPNIVVHLNSEIQEVHGDEAQNHVDRLSVLDRVSGRVEPVDATGMFVFIGAEPHTKWMEGVTVDKRGFVLTGGHLDNGEAAWAGPDGADATSMPGVFAIGDVKAGTTKRVGAAVGGGSSVIPQVHQYLAAFEQQLGLTEQTGQRFVSSCPLTTTRLDLAEVALNGLVRALGKQYTIEHNEGNGTGTDPWVLQPIGGGDPARDLSLTINIHEGEDGLHLDVGVASDQLNGSETEMKQRADQFASNLGEHLNRRIKVIESAEAHRAQPRSVEGTRPAPVRGEMGA